MSTRLVNVRLDEQRIQRARRLRSQGITLSDLVREAIDQRYEQLQQSAKRRDVDVIMNEIYDRHPDPPNLRARNYDVHDRRQARKAIIGKLSRKK